MDWGALFIKYGPVLIALLQKYLEKKNQPQGLVTCDDCPKQRAFDALMAELDKE